MRNTTKIQQSITNRDSESFDKYLKDINPKQLITPDREVELAKQIKRGSLEAQNELVEANLRFVVSIAKQYQGRGLDISDLVSEGNIGLIKAAQKFDETKGIKFISYAVWWIRQSIFQSLNENSRTIRLPVNIVQEMQKEKKNFKPIDEFEYNDRFANLPTTQSYNRINEEGDEHINSIADQNGEMPDDPFDTKTQLVAKLMTMLDILDSREKGIISEYFGLSGKPKTLEEIGSGLNLTKERVRQIKEKALRKLRNDSMELFEYM